MVCRRNLLLTFLFSLILLGGCSAPSSRYSFQMPQSYEPAAVENSTASRQLVWPSPPEVARYRYVGDIRGESNRLPGKIPDSLLARFFSAIVGVERQLDSVIDLLRPQQVMVDESERIYVADAGRQSVFVFDQQNNEFLIWNESNLNIPFLSPIGIVIADNKVLVTDSEQSVVYRLSFTGELIDSIGRNVLKRPTGISYDVVTKRIFIADTGDDNIKVFDLQGTLIDVYGNKGTRVGEFNRPTFLSYKNGLLYVADSMNARVQVLNDQGDSVNSIGERGLFIGNLSRPKGLATDSDGNIYVAESYYDHVLIYNASGELLMSLGGPGNQAGKFSQPTGLWVDDQDRLYVSDMLNSRVSVFQYLGGQEHEK